MKIEEILKKYPPDKENILLILHEIQDNHPKHFLPEEDLKAVVRYLNTTMSHVFGVAGYYSMFSTTPRGKYIIRVCKSPVCHMAKSELIINQIRKHFHLDINNTTSDGLYTLEHSECLGLCAEGPAMMINEKVYTGLTEQNVTDIIQSHK